MITREDVIKKARETLQSINTDDRLHEIVVPVFKPFEVLSSDVPAVKDKLMSDHWRVYFERDLNDLSRWNFKKIED